MNATPAIRRRENQVAAALLALIVLTVFAPWLFTGKTLYWGDIGLFFLPLAGFLQKNLAHGVIPLWNPDLFCGAPFVGNPQVSPFYPITSPLLALVPAATAIMIALALHVFAAGLFFFRLIRAQSPKIALVPAVLGASVYMLGGYFVGKAQFPNMLEALAYVPLVLLLTRRFVERPTPGSVVLFGLALGLQLLAAHVQICVLTFYLALAYGLWHYAGLKPRPPFGRVALAGLAGGVIGVALSCSYWLPTAELVRAAARQTLSLHDANRFHLLPYQWTNFIFPHRYGSPMGGDWRAAGNYWETACYIGIAPAALAAFAVARSFRRAAPGARTDRFWAVCCIIGVWLALGQWGGLYGVAFRVVPGLKAFHDPGRFLLGLALGAGMLAASGAEAALTYLRAPRVRLIAGTALLAVCVLDLGWQARGMYPLKPVSEIAAMSDAPIPTALRAENADASPSGRELMPDSPRSWHEFTTYRRFSQNDPEFLNQWADTVSPCLNMSDGLREMGGYDPETRRDSQDFVTRGDGYIGFDAVEYGHAKPVVPPGFAAFLGMLSVRDVVTFRVKPLDVPDLSLRQSGDWMRDHKRVRVYANGAYQARARCYTGWDIVPDQKAALALLDRDMATKSRPDGFHEAILEQPAQGTVPPGSNDVRREAPCGLHITSDDPDAVSIAVPAGTGTRLVVLADTEHPGWTALLDGRPTPLLRANVAQRAVFLPAGTPNEHTVTFRYRPIDFLFGLYVSLTTVMFLAGWSAFAWFRIDRRPSHAGEDFEASAVKNQN